MLSRSREVRTNLGNYEHLQMSAMVVVHDADLYTEEEIAGMTPDDVMAGLRAFAEKALDAQLDPELDAAENLSDAPASMLFKTTPAPAARPGRTEKVRRSTR